MIPIQISVTNKSDQVINLTGKELLNKKCNSDLKIVSCHSKRPLETMHIKEMKTSLIRFYTSSHKDVFDVVQTIEFSDGKQLQLKEYDSEHRFSKRYLDIPINTQLSEIVIPIGAKSGLVITFFPADKVLKR